MVWREYPEEYFKIESQIKDARRVE